MTRFIITVTVPVKEYEDEVREALADLDMRFPMGTLTITEEP